MTESFRKPGRPRVIRRVMRKDRFGRPKVARDRKTMLQVERIKAGVDKPCRAGERRGGQCEVTISSTIYAGTEFARLTNPARVKRMGNRMIPDHRDYHFECLPPEAKPLARFFK